MKSTDEIKTRTCIVSADDYGIIHKTVRPNAHLDASDIKESDDIAFDLTNGKKALILYDARPAFTLTQDGMEYLHKHLLSKNRIASAIVSEHAAVKMLVDYFDNKQVAKGPKIKLFKTMGEAASWLLTFKHIKLSPKSYKDKRAIKPVKPGKKATGRVTHQPIKGVLTTGIARVEVGKDDVAYKRVLKDVHIDLPSLKQSFKETVGFLGKEKRLMVYDLRPHFTITDDALNYVIDDIMGGHGIATAVLAKTIGVYLMADYAVNIKKIKSPLKVFTDEAAALKWLEKQKN